MLSLLAAAALTLAPQDWPQGTGPHGTFGADGTAPPIAFSVTDGTNIRWRTPLPETGQGGIAVVGNRLFLATMAPWDPKTGPLSDEDTQRFSHAIEKRKVVGKDIDAHCLDVETGKLLWTRRIEGAVPSIYSYPFSDATSASPVADGAHVWFTNAGGRTVCFNHAGEQVWSRKFDPTIAGPFNKQFEPFLVRDGDIPVLVQMEAFEAPANQAGVDDQRWHFLVGLDARTGDVRWRSDDALTHYNTPTLVERAEVGAGASPALLIGRGGPHAVPERPVGVSLVELTGENAGKSLWRFDDPRAATVKGHEAALNCMTHDDLYAYWVLKNPANAIVVLDLASGKEVREISLTQSVTRTRYDREMERLVTEKEVDLAKGVMPARYTTIATGPRSGKGPLEGRAAFSGGSTNGGLSSQTRRFVLFQCYATAWGKPTIGPEYSFARVDPVAGTVEYLEVPVDLQSIEAAQPTFIWKEPRRALALNSRGVEVTGDDRSRWSGWDWVFNGAPTRVNERVYFTVASGLVYAIDAFAAHFDARALLSVSDLGPAGKTWSANTMSFASGRLYHRTAAELICVGR